jgi:hypothetical protein
VCGTLGYAGRLWTQVLGPPLVGCVEKQRPPMHIRAATAVPCMPSRLCVTPKRRQQGPSLLPHTNTNTLSLPPSPHHPFDPQPQPGTTTSAAAMCAAATAGAGAGSFAASLVAFGGSSGGGLVAADARQGARRSGDGPQPPQQQAGRGAAGEGEREGAPVSSSPPAPPAEGVVTAAELAACDVVLTSYDVIRRELAIQPDAEEPQRSLRCVGAGTQVFLLARGFVSGFRGMLCLCVHWPEPAHSTAKMHECVYITRYCRGRTSAGLRQQNSTFNPH